MVYKWHSSCQLGDGLCYRSYLLGEPASQPLICYLVKTLKIEALGKHTPRPRLFKIPRTHSLGKGHISHVSKYTHVIIELNMGQVWAKKHFKHTMKGFDQYEFQFLYKSDGPSKAMYTSTSPYNHHLTNIFKGFPPPFFIFHF